MKTLTTTFWKKYFREYDTLNLLIPYADLLNYICSVLEVKSGDKILDAGSGTGNISVLLSDKKAEVIAVDYSEAGIEIHRSKDPSALIFQHDLTKPLPFPADYFNKIVTNNVLYTIPRQEREDIYHEFYRVLKPGGKIVISNLVIGFSPKRIYQKHLEEYKKTHGIFRTITHVLSFLFPTIKIFYYNYLIKKAHQTGSYDFFTPEEQSEALKRAKFINISPNMYTYAGQAILNTAQK